MLGVLLAQLLVQGGQLGVLCAQHVDFVLKELARVFLLREGPLGGPELGLAGLQLRPCRGQLALQNLDLRPELPDGSLLGGQLDAQQGRLRRDARPRLTLRGAPPPGGAPLACRSPLPGAFPGGCRPGICPRLPLPRRGGGILDAGELLDGRGQGLGFGLLSLVLRPDSSQLAAQTRSRNLQVRLAALEGVDRGVPRRQGALQLGHEFLVRPAARSGAPAGGGAAAAGLVRRHHVAGSLHERCDLQLVGGYLVLRRLELPLQVGLRLFGAVPRGLQRPHLSLQELELAFARV